MKRLFILFAFCFLIQSVKAQWQKTELKDEFGDKTGKFRATVATQGTFSNSATRESDLIVKMLVAKDGLKGGLIFYLYEYDLNNPAVTTSMDGRIVLKMKPQNGEVVEIRNVSPFYVSVLGKKKWPQMLKLLQTEKQPIKAVLLVTDYGNTSTYRFEIPVENFNEAYNSLENFE
jgi:hypothetical protein